MCLVHGEKLGVEHGVGSCILLVLGLERLVASRYRWVLFPCRSHVAFTPCWCIRTKASNARAPSSPYIQMGSRRYAGLLASLLIGCICRQMAVIARLTRSKSEGHARVLMEGQVYAGTSRYLRSTSPASTGTTCDWSFLISDNKHVNKQTNHRMGWRHDRTS